MQPAAERTGRRSNPVTISFWLGGFALGMGGCLVGACMPYRHPVGVTLSVCWWAFYFGCFGAWLGAMFGIWWDQIRACPPSVGISANRDSVQADTGAAGYADLVIRPSSWLGASLAVTKPELAQAALKYCKPPTRKRQSDRF
jgi:hypothetical protein